MRADDLSLVRAAVSGTDAIVTAGCGIKLRSVRVCVLRSAGTTYTARSSSSGHARSAKPLSTTRSLVEVPSGMRVMTTSVELAGPGSTFSRSSQRNAKVCGSSTVSTRAR